MKIARTLRFRNPKDVYEALLYNKEVKRWLIFISNNYIPPRTKILLIYPCSSRKPYNESRSYKVLFNTLAKLGEKRKEVHVLTISEPFGIVPEEFYGKTTYWHDWKNRWYDCPGLFEWWCRRHKQPYSREYLEKSINVLASYVSKFLKRLKKGPNPPRVIAFVRTYTHSLKVRHDHTHRKIIEKAARIAKLDVRILPDKRLVSRIVSLHGRLAWDLYGVAHPLAQEYLLKYLKGVLHEVTN
jgi:archaeosine synthase